MSESSDPRESAPNLPGIIRWGVSFGAFVGVVRQSPTILRRRKTSRFPRACKTYTETQPEKGPVWVDRFDAGSYGSNRFDHVTISGPPKGHSSSPPTGDGRFSPTRPSHKQ